MDDERKATLARMAFSRSAEPGRLMLKVQAIDDLWREFVIDRGSPTWERLREELLAVANARAAARSYQGQRAVQMSMRLLAELETGAQEQWPSPTPDAPAGPDFWPFCCHPAHHRQEPFRELDAGTQGQRDEWREQVEGPPPWRHPPMDELAADAA